MFRKAAGNTFVFLMLAILCVWNTAADLFNGSVIRKSCKDIKAENPSAPSGEYTLIKPTGRILSKVYCEMGLNGSGYTFIHPFDLPSLTQAELNAMFTDTGSFLLRLRLSNGVQKYGVLEQLSQHSSKPLSLQVNSNQCFTTRHT